VVKQKGRHRKDGGQFELFLFPGAGAPGMPDQWMFFQI
jgi:hypothetical protein